MSGKFLSKSLLLQLIRPMADKVPTGILSGLSGQRLILPLYHTISDRPLSHLKHLYPVRNTQQFEQDLDFLLQQYTPIDPLDLQHHLDHQIPLKKDSFLISFDDGFREFHDIVAPILLRKGVPAICFLNSGFIDNKELMFRCKASILIESLSNRKAVQKIDNWFEKHFFPNTSSKKNLLAVNYDQQVLLDELATMLEVDFEAYLTNEKPYLSTEQIQSLTAQGFYFGAHSIDHPEYRFLPEEEQLRQTRESLQYITEKFDIPYRFFAFPFTDYQITNNFFRQIYKKEKLVDLTFGGAGLKADIYPQHLQRTAMEIGPFTARAIIHTDLMYYLVKIPFGKNKMEREESGKMGK